jgi:hypothetical protein
VHDLDHVTRRKLRARVLSAGHDFPISLDRDRAVRQPQNLHQTAHGHAARNIACFAVYRDLHRSLLFLLWGVGQVKRASIRAEARASVLALGGQGR